MRLYVSRRPRTGSAGYRDLHLATRMPRGRECAASAPRQGGSARQTPYALYVGLVEPVELIMELMLVRPVSCV